MQFTIATLFLAAAAAAAPSVDSNGNGVARRQAAPFCPPGLLYSVPQCCDVDVLGVADLDCVVRKCKYEQLFGIESKHSSNDMKKIAPSGPSKCKTFKGICSSIGREPKCCVLPIVSCVPSLYDSSGLLTVHCLGWPSPSLH